MGAIVLVFTVLFLGGVILGGIVPGLLGLAAATSFLSPSSIGPILLIIVVVGSLLSIGRIVGAALEGTRSGLTSSPVITRALTLCAVGVIGGTSLGRSLLTDSLALSLGAKDLRQISLLISMSAGAALSLGALVGAAVLLVSCGCELVAQIIISQTTSMRVPWGAFRMLSWIAVIGLGWNAIVGLIVQEYAPLSFARQVVMP